VRGTPNEKTGMVINMADMKIILDEILQSLDHRHLDLDIEYFSRHPSTSENLAVYIWEQFEKRLFGYDCDLAEVKVDETEHNSAVYKGELSKET
jgi:6-pyruvoyltetrahydropterin/6-carboxytetrahydropterin synthase